jgi:hypothetical protein
MRVGIDGVMERISTHLARAEGVEKETYRAFAYALEGLSTLIGNAADTVETSVVEAPDWRQEELRPLASACRHIVHDPPVTFSLAIKLEFEGLPALWKARLRAVAEVAASEVHAVVRGTAPMVEREV